MLLDAETTSDTDVETSDTPIIYADGERDDLPGLAAAIAGHEVEFRGKVYRQWEAIDLRDLHLRISRYIVIRSGDGYTLLDGRDGTTFDAPEGYPHVIVTLGARQVSISSCAFESMPPLSDWAGEPPAFG